MPADRIGPGSLSELLAEARQDGLFSAAAWAVGSGDRVLERGQLGTHLREDCGEGGADPINESALFDLASVTKPIVAIAALALAEKGILSLADTVGELLPEFADATSAQVTLYGLLTHTSGLPGGVKLFRSCADAEAMFAALATLPLRNEGDWEYSSQGFMLVGEIVARHSGMPLDRAVSRLVTGPLGMTDTVFNPSDANRCVATEWCPWRGELVRGQVHDENAVVLGGVCGHAGLFAPLADLVTLGQNLLSTRDPVPLQAPMRRAMVDPVTGPLGWWPPTRGTAAGDLMSRHSYGHTGFTGTSLFIDPELDRFFVLLTNRVHPTRENPRFAAVRRRFHNLAVTTFC